MSNIIADSSLDINESLKSLDVQFVPFKLYLGEKEYIDDDTLNPIDFINDMVDYSGVGKSACPSPNDFLEKFDEKKDNFVVTISEKLSGTYNSAILAKNLYEENHEEGFVHVFNSKSASIGETLTAIKIKELIDQNVSRENIVKNVEDYIENMRTFFISENLDNLIKNGRISKMRGTIASILNIKPIMGTNRAGEIILYDKQRGIKKAYTRLKEIVVETANDCSEKTLAISHVNNLKRAEYIKSLIQEECNFKDIVIVQTGGLSSLYCDNKGIILAF
jgi:DegV family protein with EDD domain